VTRLSQVVQNLLTNAAKYTEPGGRIELEAKRHDGIIELRVADTGVGISPEMLPVVFDLFVQGRQTLDRSQGGLGLGLTLVRTMVELHGGTVEARSAGVGRGSEFIVRIPAAQLAAPATGRRRSARRIAQRHGVRTLVVDDNRDAASMLCDALRAFGYDVRVASDGPAALDVAARFRPQIVLLDLGLPVMDGYEVAERLHQAEGVSPLIVAVTGYGQETDRARSEASGFSAHLVKPVDLDQLRQTFDRLLAPVAESLR